MSTATITDQVAEKKAKLAARLLEIKDKWPYAEKSFWCIMNDLNTDRVNRSYLNGAVPSIPVAEKMIEAIEAYMTANNIAA